MLKKYVPEIEFTPLHSCYSYLLVANISFVVALSK